MAERRATAATFLFTDIEGSTQLLKRLRDRYAAVLDEHSSLLRAAFEAHDGREVDTQGDAFFVAFSRARDAVLAAVDAQRALAGHPWPDGVEVSVRIGIHTGEAAVAERRYVGLSVHRAARICALARGGQILVSQTTHNVLEDDEEPLAGLSWRDLGERRLKDLARPVRLLEVVIDDGATASATPESAASGGHAGLPGPLALTSPFPFVGREAELDTLVGLVPFGEEGRRQVALVSGEPGSGKSRLVRELAHAAVARGALALHGSADAVVNAPYQPFVEALDFLVRTSDADLLRRCVGTGGGEISRLLPELAARLGPFPQPADTDPDTARHRLHTAVADLLFELGRSQPLLVIVDDAHWADAPTLHLIRQLARAGEIRMLLLVAFRDREALDRPELSDTLADVSRIDGVTRLRLGPLGENPVAEFVQRSAGGTSATEVSDVARSIGELTGGNAFLVCELWRTLLESGTVQVSDAAVRLARPVAELSTPESVREVVQFRLSRLAPETTAQLEVAALVGAEFELAVLREASRLDEAEFAAALDEAVRSGMIEEVPGPELTRRFAHELVRRALADRLTSVRRAELHLRVGEATETVYSANQSRVLADLAHHFTEAAAIGGVERAVRYSVRAADAAIASFAYEDAADHLARALALGVDDEEERARLELERGTAHDRAGQTAEALDAYRSAAEIARRRRDVATLAHAALGHEEAASQPMTTGEESVALLREAIAALGAGESALHARLLSALSRALVFIAEHEEAAALRLEAIAIARRLGDLPTLARILIQAESRNTRAPPEEMLVGFTEARDLAASIGDTYVHLEAMWRRIPLIVATGDLHAARRDVEEYRHAAEQGGEPIKIHTAELFGSALALCDGKLDEAEAMAERAEEWAQLLRFPKPSGEYGVQMFGIRREQGRLAELQPVVQLLASSPSEDATWLPGLIALLVELGMRDEAETELEKIRADGVSSAALRLSTASLVYLTDACTAVRDADTAAVLYPLLEPLAARTVQIGHLVACYGAGDRYLGMLAGVVRDWDVAEAHFEYALYVNRRSGANTWAAHTAYEYARMLLDRGHESDRAHARELLADASDACKRFDLVGLQRKIEALPSPDVAHATLPDELSAREADVLRLVARGLSNRDIGRELFISEHTAANHVRSILRKTGCANRTDAAAYAYRRGIVRDP